MTNNSGDIFGNARAYEGYVGRWSHFVAQHFVKWLDIAPLSTWLDVGAGTGILTRIILEQASPTKVLGVDLSPDYIDFARQHVRDERAEFVVGDADNIAIDSPPFDAAVAGLVLNFVASPEAAVKGIIHALKPGGLAAAYVWDYGGKMEMMRHFWDAAIKVDPAAREVDAGQRFAICKPDNLRALFQSLNLNAVDVIPIDIPTPFKNFDDFWLPFLGAQGSVSKYLRGLSDETKGAVRDQLKEQLPTAADGSITLVARAWAVKGTRDLSA